MGDKMNKQVYEILKMPIQCNKGIKQIKYEDGKILTGQSYINYADEDMSNLAIGFYKILYGKDIIHSDGRLNNLDFVGDTMNSFNSIANVYPNTGQTIGKEHQKIVGIKS